MSRAEDRAQRVTKATNRCAFADVSQIDQPHLYFYYDGKWQTHHKYQPSTIIFVKRNDQFGLFVSKNVIFQ